MAIFTFENLDDIDLTEPRHGPDYSGVDARPAGIRTHAGAFGVRDTIIPLYESMSMITTSALDLRGSMWSVRHRLRQPANVVVNLMMLKRVKRLVFDPR